MYIVLVDGTQFTTQSNPVASTKYIQGANRDIITFIFDESYTYDELDAAFTEENCEIIDIVTEDSQELEDGSTQIIQTDNFHKGYVIKSSISKEIVQISPATVDTPAVSETRFQVVMAQRTYMETQLAAITEEITNTQLALCEIYEGGI